LLLPQQQQQQHEAGKGENFGNPSTFGRTTERNSTVNLVEVCISTTQALKPFSALVGDFTREVMRQEMAARDSAALVTC
jgi:hypothetical protein